MLYFFIVLICIASIFFILGARNTKSTEEFSVLCKSILSDPRATADLVPVIEEVIEIIDTRNKIEHRSIRGKLKNVYYH